jgi:hypothetical protein
LTYFLEFYVSVCGTASIRLPVCPFPPAGTVAAPVGSPAVCRLRRYYGRIRLLADPSLPPPVSLGGRYSTSRVCSLPVRHPRFPRDLVLFGLGRTAPSSGEVGCSPGFTGSPLESMPRARDSGDPRATSPIGCLDAAFRYPNGVGVAMMSDVGAESSRPASLLCTLRTRRSPNERQHSLPVGPLRL